MKEEKLKEIIAWLRDPKIKSPMRKTWREVLANRLEKVTKRAYEEIDKAVTGSKDAIECAKACVKLRFKNYGEITIDDVEG